MDFKWYEVNLVCRLAKRGGDIGAVYSLLMDLHDKVFYNADSKEDAVRAIKLYALAIRDSYGEVF